MAAQKGKDVLLKVDDGASTFNTVGGIRSKSISLNSETVDITNGDSANEWRELLANAGVRSASISGSGVFTDSASEEDVRGYFMAGTIDTYQVIVPDFGTFEGDFQVTSLEYSGEYNGEAAFSITLESAGAIAWTAI